MAEFLNSKISLGHSFDSFGDSSISVENKNSTQISIKTYISNISCLIRNYYVTRKPRKVQYSLKILESYFTISNVTWKISLS